MRNFIYCLFFPHPMNNHRARILQPKALLLVISFFVFSSFFFSSQFNPLGNRIRAFADISTTELLNFTNQKREANGLPDLSDNSQLTLAAQRKADDMFTKNYWSHNSPDGTTPWVFITGAGYQYVYAGENLARGFNSANDVVNAWMASPDHRANLLSPNYSDVGFAVESGKLSGEETFLVVQEFGSKASSPVVPAKITIPPPKKVLGFNTSQIASDIENKPNLSTSSSITLLIILGFLAILTIDTIVIERKKVVRFVGHNLDHVFFLSAIMLAIVLFNLSSVL